MLYKNIIQNAKLNRLVVGTFRKIFYRVICYTLGAFHLAITIARIKLFLFNIWHDFKNDKWNAALVLNFH